MIDKKEKSDIRKWKESPERLIFRAESACAGYHDKTEGINGLIQFFEYKNNLPDVEWLSPSRSNNVIIYGTSIPCKWYLLDDKSFHDDYYDNSSSEYIRYSDKQILLLDPFGFKGVQMLDVRIKDYYF